MTDLQRFGKAIEILAQTCLECRHCEVWPKILDTWEIQCCKEHWAFDGRGTTKEMLKSCLYTAKTCKDFQNGR